MPSLTIVSFMATVPHNSYLNLAKFGDYLELVKFSHTIFALPFALASMLIAKGGCAGQLDDCLDFSGDGDGAHGGHGL